MLEYGEAKGAKKKQKLFGCSTTPGNEKEKKSEVIKWIDVTRNSGRICYLVSICYYRSTLEIQRPQSAQSACALHQLHYNVRVGKCVFLSLSLLLLL